MTEPALVAINLTGEERELMVLALNEYAGTAQHTYQLLCPVLGQPNIHEWAHLLNRLKEAIKNGEPLSDLDWARALFLQTSPLGAHWSAQACVLDDPLMNIGFGYSDRSKKKSAAMSGSVSWCEIPATHPFR